MSRLTARARRLQCSLNRRGELSNRSQRCDCAVRQGVRQRSLVLQPGEYARRCISLPRSFALSTCHSRAIDRAMLWDCAPETTKYAIPCCGWPAAPAAAPAPPATADVAATSARPLPVLHICCRQRWRNRPTIRSSSATLRCAPCSPSDLPRHAADLQRPLAPRPRHFLRSGSRKRSRGMSPHFCARSANVDFGMPR